MRRALLGWLVAGCVLPGIADAATVRAVYAPADSHGFSQGSIVFTAAPSEHNQVSVVAVSTGSTWLLHDDGAPVTAGEGCTAIDAHTAGCTLTSANALAVVIEAGDGGDTVRTPDSSPGYAVDGGAGADVLQGGGTLRGGDGDDTLTGSPQNDTLSGGPGYDTLRGLDGNDILDGDGGSGLPEQSGANDTLDGGPGSDTASYEHRTTPIYADLSTSVAGGVGERDALVSIESVTGGTADDTLDGDDGANQIQGGPGDDTLRGHGGDDVLSDGGGTDHLDGGDGNDLLTGAQAGDTLAGSFGSDHLQTLAPVARADGGPGDDTISITAPPTSLACGPGTDTLQGPGVAGQRVDGCEQITEGAFGLLTIAATPTRTTPAGLQLPVTCRAQGTSIVNGCTGNVQITLRGAGRPPVRLGAATFRLHAGQSGHATLRLTRANRIALRRHGSHPVLALELTAHGTLDPSFRPPFPVALGGGGGIPLAAAWRLRL